jgi:ABC-2 type transport system permease protein
VVLFLLLSFIYKNEQIRELPVAMYDGDNSVLSRRIIENIESSPQLSIEKYVFSVKKIKDLIRKGEIEGAIHIPHKMEKRVKRGKPATVTVYKNTSNLVIGNIIFKDASTIIRSVSGKILHNKLQNNGLDSEQAMNIVKPVNIETQVLFNSNYSYLSYLIPGLLAFLIQMIAMVVSVIIINSEFENHTFSDLIDTADAKVHSVLLGKFLPHFAIQCVNSFFIIGIVFYGFNIPVYGSIMEISLLFGLFAAVNILLGMMISTLVKDELLATEIVIFYNTPAFIFSGFTFPLWSMPVIHSIYAQLMPFTHFLSAYLKIYQMNASFDLLVKDILILTGFLLIGLTTTSIALYLKIKKARTADVV